MKYMVSFHFRPEQQAEVMARVPAEQARIRELVAEGTVEVLYLAADRGAGWLVMVGDSSAAIETALATLPLHPYMELEIVPLR